MDTLLQFLSKTNNRIDSCCNCNGPSIAIEVEEYRKLLFDLKTRSIKVRYITEITKENVQYCKELMKFDYEIRHLDGIKANFSINETEYIASISLQKAQPIPQAIYTNVIDIVEQQKYIFETLWGKSLPAEQKIREMEEGISLGNTEIIRDSAQTKEVFVDLVRSAEYEILLILPTVNAFLREERIGIPQLLIDAIEKKRNIKVRILTPTSDLIEKKLKRLEQEIDDNKKRNFELRRTVSEPEMKSTIMVIDRKVSLVTELKDDSKDDIVDAIGLTSYSTSKPTILSYISIFEKFWKQMELYEQLKVHDRMQKEFINIASHEMKTPTQAIIGYADLLQRHPENREQMIHAISRNAIRLQRLTEDILDVTRIESQTFSLNKEQFDLNDLIINVVEDYRSQIEKENRNIKLLYNKPNDEDLLIVNADKGRITQALSNLLSNAIKFIRTEGSSNNSNSTTGIISITAKEEANGNNNNNDNNNQQVIVSIKDNGEGIHPEIFPRLFTKFTTKSNTSGTGLGLFITKSIIEAHGGALWAKNNSDGERRGATFAFSLPLSKKQQQQEQEHKKQEYSIKKQQLNGYQK